MEYSDIIYKEIMGVVNNNFRIKDRSKELKKMGYIVEEKRCGSGGVGQIINLKNETRIQIGYGHSDYNYAACVILGSLKEIRKEKINKLNKII